MAVLGVPMLLGPIGGPILGGWLIDIASWHWIFLINVPIGIGALVYAFIVLPKDSPSPSESFDAIGFALLSPGLAIFLYGVSSIPGTGTVMAAKVLIPVAVGLALIIAFVHHALTRAEHPLIDLHLFRNRELSIAVITMASFAVAFFGAMLLFPQYFIGVRGQTPLMAGVLGAPMGLGAMLTMPLAGAMTDKFGPGKFVMGGLVLIVAGMFPLTMLKTDTSFWLTSGSFFVMGLGMGMTMMPTMSAALRTLREAQIARGSTLMNITQQVSASIGTAVMSVLLTTFLKQDSLAPLAIYANTGSAAGTAALKNAAAAAGQPVESLLAKGLDSAATAFSHTILIALILVACTLIPAFFLPRSRAAETDQAATLEAEQVGDAVLG
jgi:EmrB/QacA subfamily drug resistance transporter